MASEAKHKLLLAALKHVPFSGYSDASLNAATKDTGVSLPDVRRHFPHGAIDLVEAFSEMADSEMRHRLNDAKETRIRDRISLAVRVRLEAMASHREAARRAAAFLALPQNAPLAAKLMFETVDAMWRATGDQSSDFNYYTKRALLAGVYSATLLHWLSDSSEDRRDSWVFLDARIEDVMKIQKMRGGLEKAFENLPNLIDIFSGIKKSSRR
jgi:ubiquinone biosynthesis protein COQ9